MENADLTNESAVMSEREYESADTSTGKKKFVTPEISAPVDVLEATTFFQAATSGATN